MNVPDMLAADAALASGEWRPPRTMLAALDEIERLRAALEAMRTAAIAQCASHAPGGKVLQQEADELLMMAASLARAALAGPKP